MRFGLNVAPQKRVFGAFFIYSFALGGIYPRLGDVQSEMGIGEGALGLALIGTALGTQISLAFSGRILDRIGYRRTLVVLIPVLSALYALASFAPGPLVFFLVLVPAGLAVGAIEIIINVEADRTEHKIGKRIMNRAHAFWSFGFFSAGLAGALAKQAGLSAQNQLMLAVLVVVVATILMLGRYDPAPMRYPAPTGDAVPPLFARPTGPIMILVVLTLSAMLLEGAQLDWSAIYMRDTFSALPFVAGFAVAAGAGTQAVARFFADTVIERYGAERIARALILILGAGTLLVVFTPDQTLALIGFGLMGVGTSAIFPLAVSAAAQRTDRPAAINVAALAQISFLVFFFAPPLLGFVAEHAGIRVSFAIGLPLIVISWLMIPILRPAVKTRAKTSRRHD